MERQWAECSGSTAPAHVPPLRVVTWNVQAERTRPDARGVAISAANAIKAIDRILELRPDVLFLQEVQMRGRGSSCAALSKKADHALLFRERLSTAGFDVFLAEPAVPAAGPDGLPHHSDNRREGRQRAALTVLTAWRLSRVRSFSGSLVPHSVPLSHFSHKEAAVVVLGDRLTGHLVVTCNCHLSVPVAMESAEYTQQMRELDACLQATAAAANAVAAQTLEKGVGDAQRAALLAAATHGPATLAGPHCGWQQLGAGQVRVLFAGDLNAIPQSKTCQTLRSAGMRSAYALALGGSEPAYTTVNRSAGFVDTVDYIWTSRPGLRVLRVLDVHRTIPDWLPNESCPSDHEPLVAELLLTPIAAKRSRAREPAGAAPTPVCRGLSAATQLRAIAAVSPREGAIPPSAASAKPFARYAGSQPPSLHRLRLHSLLRRWQANRFKLMLRVRRLRMMQLVARQRSY